MFTPKLIYQEEIVLFLFNFIEYEKFKKKFTIFNFYQKSVAFQIVNRININNFREVNLLQF